MAVDINGEQERNRAAWRPPTEGPIISDDLKMLDDYRSSVREAYGEAYAVLQRLSETKPTGRPAKSTTSIVQKLRRETARLSQMQDIAGCRAVVGSLTTQNVLVKQLTARFGRPEADDRRAQPSHGYRAVHVVPRIGGKQVETQVRTHLQHIWAELPEKLSDTYDPSIRYVGGPKRAVQILGLLSEEFFRLETKIEQQEAKLDEHHRRLDHLRSHVETAEMSIHVQRKAIVEVDKLERENLAFRAALDEVVKEARSQTTRLFKSLVKELEDEKSSF